MLRHFFLMPQRLVCRLRVFSLGAHVSRPNNSIMEGETRVRGGRLCHNAHLHSLHTLSRRKEAETSLSPPPWGHTWAWRQNSQEVLVACLFQAFLFVQRWCLTQPSSWSPTEARYFHSSYKRCSFSWFKSRKYTCKCLESHNSKGRQAAIILDLSYKWDGQLRPGRAGMVSSVPAPR